MVIQHNDRLAEAQQIGAFRDGRLIYVHDHKYTVSAGGLNCLLVPYNHVLLIFRIADEHIHHRLNIRCRIIQYDMRLSSQGLRNAVDTHRRAKAVSIRHTMSHDEHKILAGDNLAECMRLHPRLHSCIFLYLLALAAVIGNALRRLDDRLIAAASQRKINGIARELIVLGIGQSVETDTDAERHRHLVSDVDRLHFLQQIKAALLQLCNHLLPENDKIFVLLELLADAVIAGNVFVDLTVDQRDQQRTSDLLYALERFLVVVEVNHSHGKTLVIHLLQGNVQRRLVIQIDRDQIAVVVLRLDHVAVLCHFLQRNLLEFGNVFIAVVFQLVLCLIHAAVIRQPVPCNRREERRDRL